MPKNKDIEIRSDEVQEILSLTPMWMIRWGITLILGIIILLLFVSWFVKYPDVINGNITITTAQPPVKLYSKSAGYIGNIYVENNAKVKKGQVITVINSTADKSSIDYLINLITSPINGDFILNDTTLKLGDIQQAYNDFVKNVKNYIQLTTDDYHKNEIANINRQMNYNRNLAAITKKQISLMKIKIGNAYQKFKTDSQLFAKGVSSKYTFYQNQSDYISQRQNFTDLKKSYIQYKITVSDFQKQKNESTEQYELKKKDLQTAISASKKTIKNFIASWQQNYVFTSPINGKLSYLTPLNQHQYIENQTPLFVVIPSNRNYIAYIQIPAQGYGKIQKGQKVNIKLSNYPYQQFGQLIGKVSNISLVPLKNQYLIKVTLPNQLITTYKNKITYTPEMIGTAQIVTKDRRLIERIFDKLHKITTR